MILLYSVVYVIRYIVTLVLHTSPLDKIITLTQDYISLNILKINRSIHIMCISFSPNVLFYVNTFRHRMKSD